MNKLLLIRSKLGWTQEYMGMLLGMSSNAISRLETGVRPLTKIHEELIEFVDFLDNANLLECYVFQRFNIRVSSRFYQGTMPRSVVNRAVNAQDVEGNQDKVYLAKIKEDMGDDEN